MPDTETDLSARRAAVRLEQELIAREASRSEAAVRRGRMRVLALQFGIFLSFLIGWTLISGTLIDHLFLSDPISVVRAFYRLIENGELWWHIQMTVMEMLLGYVIGVTLGISLAIVVTLIPFGEPIARPLMMAVYSTPKVALAPLIIIWFGIYLTPKVVLSTSLVLFIVYFNTLAGIADVNTRVIAVACVMGATPRALFTKIILPHAAPFIFSAMRITLPTSLIGAIIGEFFSSNRGIGYLIARASSRYDTAQVFASILGLLLLVLVMNILVSAVERRVMRWRPRGTIDGA
jgi:NitT/TauT family transport system permease protein